MLRTLLFTSTIALFVIASNTSCTKPQKQYTDTVNYELKTLSLTHNNCNLDSPDCAYITYTYPVFSSPKPDANIDSLNNLVLTIFGITPTQSIQQSQKTFIQEYTKFIHNNKDSEQSWYSQTNITVPYQNNRLVCLNIEMDDYTGGAHGMYMTIYNNYDKKKKQVLVMHRLFTPENLNKLLKLVEPKFRESNELKPDADLEASGYWFKDNIFHLNDNFIFTEEGITWLFNPYEIAAYVQGTIEVTIKKEDVLPLLNTEYQDIWN